jgi:hypothetical protein
MVTNPYCISVGFARNQRGFISRLFRLVMGGEYSQCYIKYTHPLYNKSLVITADFIGLVETSWQSFISRFSKCEELMPSDNSNIDLSSGISTVIDQLGTPYDFQSQFGRLVKNVLGWFGKIITTNPFADKKFDTDVDIIIRYLKAVGLMQGVNAEIYSPQMVYEYLRSQGWMPNLIISTRDDEDQNIPDDAQ